MLAQFYAEMEEANPARYATFFGNAGQPGGGDNRDETQSAS